MNTTAESSQEVVKLRLSHLWPAIAPVHVELVEPWAKKIEVDSDQMAGL